MIQALTQRLSVLLLIVGLLAPLTGGLAMAVGLSEGRVLVICTGDGLRWIAIGADGAPVEVSATAETCALVHAADTSARPNLAPMTRLAAVMDHPARAGTDPAGGIYRSAALPRAPPVS